MERTAMSRKEYERGVLLGRVESRELPLKEAAALMGVSYRQAKRLAVRYRQAGRAGLVHGQVGRPSNGHGTAGSVSRS